MRFSPRKCDTCKKLRFFWRGAAKFCSAECTIKALKECGWRPPIGKERVCIEIGFSGREFFAKWTNPQLWRVRMLGFAEEKRQKYMDGLYSILLEIMHATGAIPTELKSQMERMQEAYEAEKLRSQHKEISGTESGVNDESNSYRDSGVGYRQPTDKPVHEDRGGRVDVSGPLVFPGSIDSEDKLKAFSKAYREQTEPEDPT